MSKIHEDRLAAVILLTEQYKVGQEQQRKKIYEFYLDNVLEERINNWDIVDASAGHIVGEYLLGKPRGILRKLAVSESLWQRRVAIISTFGFIKKGDASTTIDIAEVLLQDPQDLIQKAVGWMLREVGKRVDREVLLTFLDAHAHVMPRTMLRYSIEHLPKAQKEHYMSMRATT